MQDIEPVEKLKHIAAVTSVNKMLRSSFFSICEIDNIAKMMHVHVDADSYAILRTLHCVDFKDIPKELRDNIPQLISTCLAGVSSFQFPMPFQTPPPDTIVATQLFHQKKPNVFLRLFRGER